VGPDGAPIDQQVLSLTDLGHTGTYPLSFRFRYFQDLDGEVLLPEGFQPVRVTVTATPQGGRNEVERSFDWLVEDG
jgi:hypothetical protein